MSVDIYNGIIQDTLWTSGIMGKEMGCPVPLQQRCKEHMAELGCDLIWVEQEFHKLRTSIKMTEILSAWR